MNTEKTDQKNLLREMAQVPGPVETHAATIKRISTEQFEKTNKETQSWLTENKVLREMHELAVEDYITSRHAVLSLGLFKTGLALAAQAVEKYLKCYLLAAGFSIEDSRKYNHKIQLLLEKASEITKQNDLLSYSNFCNELEKWYNSRYPDTDNPASQWMRSAIPEFDKFVCHLEEHIPIPNTITHLKYGGGEMGHGWSSIFVRLFEATFSQHRDAILNENIILIPRLNEFERRYFSDRLSATIPSNTLNESLEHSRRVQAVIRKHEKTDLP